jgi:universal stress protein A
MSIYQRILAVVDLTEDTQDVARRAVAIAQSCGASQIEFLHVVEYVPVEPLSDSLLPSVQIESELIERARRKLDELTASLGIASAPRHVEAGNVKAEIVRVARERRADLIVLGSRERHGLSILVNLTEDTVLHAAPCDVLAVRLVPLKPGA